MESVTVWLACVAAVLSVLLTGVVALAWRSSTRRTSAEIAELRQLLAEIAPTSDARAQRPVVAEFLITDAGAERPSVQGDVPPRVVLNATVGEPVVKLAAFAYGVRRALTPENRNRIRFEMRREIRRARKARRAAGRAAAAEARSQAVSG